MLWKDQCFDDECPETLYEVYGHQDGELEFSRGVVVQLDAGRPLQGEDVVRDRTTCRHTTKLWQVFISLLGNTTRRTVCTVTPRRTTSPPSAAPCGASLHVPCCFAVYRQCYPLDRRTFPLDTAPSPSPRTIFCIRDFICYFGLFLYSNSEDINVALVKKILGEGVILL